MMEKQRVKFLVIRFSAIGDVVLCSPVFRGLKEQVEGAEVHFVTKKQFAGIVEHNPYIDKVYTLEDKDNLNELLLQMKDEQYDFIIDLHKNLRSKRIKSNLSLAAFTIRKLSWEKWLLVNLKINKFPDIHVVDRYMETLNVFDVVNDGKGLEYFIPEKDNIDLNSLPENFKNGYIAFVVGAKYFTKRLPEEKVISICKKLNRPVVLLGGKEEEAAGKNIREALGELAFNACGKYNLNQSASFLKQADAVVSNDTGLMHIAAAFKKKIVSLWGNTVPDFGMYPYLSHKDSLIVEIKGLKCRPCSKLGFKQCPKIHFNCMATIDEEKIVSHITKIS